MNIHFIEPLEIAESKIKELEDHFGRKGHRMVYYRDRTTDADELIARAREADAVVIANCPFRSSVIDSLPDLKYLSVAFTGVDHVAIDACRERGIPVSNASGYANINVAELTVGLMLDILRNVTRLDAVTRNGGTKEGLVGFDLAGKTVGIIGTGAIGARVAGLLKGFDVNLLAYDLYRNPELISRGVQYCDLNELLSRSDILTLHCPLNDHTVGLIDYKRLSLMKRGSYLINCARGPVVRTEDLARALREGILAGAAIDVFDSEPPLERDHPLFPLENTVLTPHIAFATGESFSRRADIVRDNIDSWLEGEIANRVN